MSGERAQVLPVFFIFTLVAWPLVAFGGRSPGVALAVAASCICFAAAFVVAGGRFNATPSRLDLALATVLAAIALQAVPFPTVLTATLSPHAPVVRSSLALGAEALPAFIPLTIRVADTGWAWMVTAGAIAVFAVTRAQLQRGGVRQLVRLIAGLGFAVSMLAIAQAASAGRNIYWLFPTEFEGALPFGPFVNRNHFATWVIMALPTCLGYLAARAGQPTERGRHASTRTRMARAIDARTAWLTTAAIAMVVALLLSLSRSGVVALGVAVVGTTALSGARLDRRRRSRLLVIAGLIAMLGVLWADIPALRDRLAGTGSGLVNRFTIWRETLPIVRDFWVAGTGAGTYQRAMFFYQRSTRAVYFNQAHNHYLQVAAEGGILLVLAFVAAMAAFVRAARIRLTAETSGLYWIRVGAACGLSAVALQSVWETGLVMPANATLAAVLAALVVHERSIG